MTKRACDACRQRKIKCDQLSPTCSPCGLASLLCTYDVPRRKRGPKPRDRPCDMNTSIEVEMGITGFDECQTQGGPSFPSSPLSSPLSSRLSSLPPLAHGVHRMVGLESGIVNTAQPIVYYHEILSSLAKKGLTPEESVKSCINLYLEYVFPLIPVVCESILRSHASLKLPPFMDKAFSPLSPLVPDMVHSVRTYSLTAALCALIAHIKPCGDHPRDDTLAALFLTSSQATLHPYSAYDISYPNSTSLSIRIFQSSCYQMMGNACLARHVMGEAVQLAQQMRLYDERSYDGMDPIEAKLCRNAFWYLYSADRSASLLKERTLPLGEFRLQGLFTTVFCHSEAPSLLDLCRPENDGRFEELLLAGFRIGHEVWKLGFGVLFDLDLFFAASSRTGNGAEICHTQRKSLTEAYLRFVSVLDDLPDHLASPTAIRDADDERTRHKSRAFWIQKTNITLTYHYLRMSILNRFISAKIPQLLGVNDDPTSVAWRKVEIARELLNLVTSLPLEALQANGEPCAEKLRYVCVTLLEVMQEQEMAQVVERARAHFVLLLDYLSKLNSRVSDKLAASMTRMGTIIAA
ncbi:hypothetical protein B0J13DRAFT_602351 [Dactylonectria estremocensis]|uniref:Zn(2)-C6 fungal-type domain-containing protein n=1 Tax=Dactylonectria estremocensis TaxID=1079267 RepID=A0A9P9FDW4_9HYPO|nr:hypothetical protein B0J13DRAFT_602351 [Dactylonectria estremocensis]